MSRLAIIPKLTQNEHLEVLATLDIKFPKALEDMGFETTILPYCSLQNLQNSQALVISGGNDLFSLVPSHLNLLRDEFELKAINEALRLKIPILGVCKGAQSLANFLNASFTPTNSHVGEHQIHYQSGEKLTVNSYHNFAIQSLAKAQILAKSPDGFVEAFLEPKHKFIGMMWHFEREEKPSLASQKIFEIFKGYI